MWKPGHRWRRAVPIEPPWNLALQVVDFAGARIVLNRLMINKDKLKCQDAKF